MEQLFKLITHDTQLYTFAWKSTREVFSGRLHLINLHQSQTTTTNIQGKGNSACLQFFIRG